MNFSPLYYRVQDLIVKDDDKAVIDIFNNPEHKQEFLYYYQDFAHCTYPDSFKCMYFLMHGINASYNIHSSFSHAFNDNNTEWLTFFFDNFSKQLKEKLDDKGNTIPFVLRTGMKLSMDFDYASLLNSSEEVWDVLFKYMDCDIFKPPMLINEIFDKDNYPQDSSKIYLLESLCQKNSVDLPISNIITKCFQVNDLDMLEYFLNKYQPQFDSDSLTDFVNFVGLSGNIDNFKFFTQHFLPFENFDSEQITLVFNGGLLTDKIELMEYLKDTYKVDFYPANASLKEEFISNRSTLWEDNNENSPSTLTLLENVNNLFEKYSWDKNELIKEIKEHDEISQLFAKVTLNYKLNSKLDEKKSLSSKGKI